MTMRRDKHMRAETYARRTFKLEAYFEGGVRTNVSGKLRNFIQGQIALAWTKGYEAGIAAAKAETR